MVILSGFLLSGCTPTILNSNGESSRPELQEANQAPSSGQNFQGNLENFDALNLPKIQSQPKTQNEGGTVVSLIRIVPVADKEGKSIVGWRIIGELFNNSKQLLDNGQILLIAQNNTAGATPRTLLPQPAQPGGFLPVPAHERAAFDEFISSDANLENSSLNIGFRAVSEPNQLLYLDVENMKFNRQKQNDGSVKYFIAGQVINNLSKSVVGPLVRFWAVLNDQIVALSTWQAAQEILAPGQTKTFETELMPLTAIDRDLMASGSAELSALGAGKPL